MNSGRRVNVCCCCGAQACAEGSDSVKAAMTPRDRFTGALMFPCVRDTTCSAARFCKHARTLEGANHEAPGDDIPGACVQ